MDVKNQSEEDKNIMIFQNIIRETWMLKINPKKTKI